MDAALHGDHGPVHALVHVDYVHEAVNELQTPPSSTVSRRAPGPLVTDGHHEQVVDNACFEHHIPPRAGVRMPYEVRARLTAGDQDLALLVRRNRRIPKPSSKL